MPTLPLRGGLLGLAVACGSGWAPTGAGAAIPTEPAFFLDSATSAERFRLAVAESAKPVRRPARTFAEAREQRIADLSDENRALKAQIAALSINRGSAGETIPELEAKIQELRNELAAIRQSSANALQIQTERDHLHESVVRLERELETFKRENHSLKADSRQSWFLVGAGVLVGGLVLGLMMSRLGGYQRRSWDSF